MTAAVVANCVDVCVKVDDIVEQMFILTSTALDFLNDGEHDFVLRLFTTARDNAKETRLQADHLFELVPPGGKVEGDDLLRYENMGDIMARVLHDLEEPHKQLTHISTLPEILESKNAHLDSLLDDDHMLASVHSTSRVRVASLMTQRRFLTAESIIDEMLEQIRSNVGPVDLPALLTQVQALHTQAQSLGAQAVSVWNEGSELQQTEPDLLTRTGVSFNEGLNALSAAQVASDPHVAYAHLVKAQTYFTNCQSMCNRILGRGL